MTLCRLQKLTKNKYTFTYVVYLFSHSRFIGSQFTYKLKLNLRLIEYLYSDFYLLSFFSLVWCHHYWNLSYIVCCQHFLLKWNLQAFYFFQCILAVLLFYASHLFILTSYHSSNHSKVLYIEINTTIILKWILIVVYNLTFGDLFWQPQYLSLPTHNAI